MIFLQTSKEQFTLVLYKMEKPDFKKTGELSMKLRHTHILQKSFLNISKWIEELTDIGTKEMLLVLVGNKSDLADQRTVRNYCDNFV